MRCPACDRAELNERNICPRCDVGVTYRELPVIARRKPRRREDQDKIGGYTDYARTKHDHE